MSLLDELRADLINDSANVANTLRKALVLADEVASPELRAWILSELNGYPEFDNVPDYRRVYLPVYGTFLGSGVKREELITTSGLSDEMRDKADCLRVVDGVSALAHNLATGEKMFQRPLPVEMTALLRLHLRMPGMALAKTYQQVPPYVFDEVLSSVKTRLLQFVLELQKKSVISGDLTSEVVDTELVNQAFTFYITGNNNIVAVGEEVHQEVSTISKGDLEALLEHFRSHDVSSEDLLELKQAVLSESPASDGNFGPKVSSWIGKMVSKAASGAWKVGVDQAVGIVTKAILRYNGISE